MSHKKNRSLKFAQGLGYAVLTGVSAVGTVVLATATVGLAMSVVGIPLAILTAAGTAGCVAGTVYFGYKTGHKFGRAFESDDYDHDQEHYVTQVEIKHVSEHFTESQNQVKESQLKNQEDITGTSKPLFAPASKQSASNAPVMDTVSSIILEDETVAKAGM
ncbi:hypothetical protein [Legionella quateirensis]|uniref:Transmembrane protein n=1 Tax=Legionella quateirensis TaxID=45072 RepID=A0A378KQQ9_9GAMM|nr:hypothetical protein [Legionella quateirensis]KTD54712.1 hypothetical protein Lqua_0219 [Legionella quateirensis]STY16892.1 Uncharacterised protein [Legionella quateirensis]